MNQISMFDSVQQPHRRFNSSGTVRKSNGQFLAAKKAGTVWQSNALDALRKFLAVRKAGITGCFTFEEFRLHCEAQYLAKPDSVNAWGSLPAKACKANLCVWTGRFEAAMRPEAHSRFVKVWAAL